MSGIVISYTVITGDHSVLLSKFASDCIDILMF